MKKKGKFQWGRGCFGGQELHDTQDISIWKHNQRHFKIREQKSFIYNHLSASSCGLNIIITRWFLCFDLIKFKMRTSSFSLWFYIEYVSAFITSDSFSLLQKGNDMVFMKVEVGGEKENEENLLRLTVFMMRYRLGKKWTDV